MPLEENKCLLNAVISKRVDKVLMDEFICKMGSRTSFYTMIIEAGLLSLGFPLPPTDRYGEIDQVKFLQLLRKWRERISPDKKD